VSTREAWKLLVRPVDPERLSKAEPLAQTDPLRQALKAQPGPLVLSSQSVLTIPSSAGSFAQTLGPPEVKIGSSHRV
jgi:hypothetical protein